ncbi:DNA replication ATP-dependent helicase/nuclease DNA2 [Thalictrum thalictroides]|uniref:DNA helicase n=1 Tax=Thalictrum thalictroides TaxID=46969 RepID=A0A7J6XFD7_THATH|nr:DNA replication ATP-dependent helicase/nuclease DNA2 [Thalictrum thalictroides]
MAPKKKSSSSSTKKSNITQPSKFGIQHFFERHSQNASNSQNPKIVPSPQTSDSRNPSQITPPHVIPEIATPNTTTTTTVITTAITAAVEDLSEVSPEFCKSLSVKRFKFSPGMLIKQSQDDGADEVTWKISPVNERLQAVSKRLPDMVRISADASKLNGSSIRHCSLKENSVCSVCKLEKWLSSPTRNPRYKSTDFSEQVFKKPVNKDQEIEFHGSQGCGNGFRNTDTANQSPFLTPPSVSYSLDESANAIVCKGAFDQPGSRQHRKALIELLDQVEDVITVEESVPSNSGTHMSKMDDMTDGDVAVKINSLASTPQRISCLFDLNFLVLEVSEKHRTVDSTCVQCPFKVLRLLNEQTGEERALQLHDEWFYSIIGPGDTINVIGEFDDQGKCIVDHENNLFIVHPDILLSGTRVAASFGCPRRTVLDERLKCNEHSTAALMGTMLHQIFQAGLLTECPTLDYLEKYARIVLQKNTESMYACGVNENDMQATLIEAIPRMLNWITCFRSSQDFEVPTVDFGLNNEYKKVHIAEVMDIEEMAWAPRFGLKGVIDASVRVKVDSNIKDTNVKIMPLEFKTGKATSGQASQSLAFMEHCAQVVLYTLLMSERYLKHIDSGLLYYLHTDQTQGITVKRSDLVGLIMRRNELANDILKASTVQQLPQMLQNPNMCRSCRHLNVCTIYHKAHGGNTESSGLGDMFDSNVKHLTTDHCNFLRQWDRLIDLEAEETQVAKKKLWRLQEQGECSTSGLSSIKLDLSNDLSPNKSSKGGRFIYRFVREELPLRNVENHDGEAPDAAPPLINNLDCTLKCGDYVILSKESRSIAVTSGIITDISRFHVSVSLSRRLRLPGSSPSSETVDLLQESWRIDKDEVITFYAIMRFNLVQLFVPSAQSSHLRKMIVDLESPRYDSGVILSQDPALAYVRSEKNLNHDQRRAIHKILTAKDYALILGMPGTGKTSTMVHAVKALLIRGSSILLTSYTNSAVDNLLIKLKLQGIDFVRIGRYEAVHEEVRDHCLSEASTGSVEDIRLRLDQVKVVAVTCLGITHPLLSKKRFDICIMDEAGQTTLPVSLGPLMFASTFVLVGDHYQLPPLVQSTEARENGMGTSLFCRLSEAHPQAISALQSQYRMCAGIMELSNALIYGNRLRCGLSEIAEAKLKFASALYNAPWVKEVLDPNRSVVLVNTDMLPALEVREYKTVNNPTEANIVAQITEELVNKGIVEEEIGIITPYNSQASLIRRVVGTTNVEIHTIDKYQGRDKDCILLSFVRSSENPRSCTSSLLGDWHRINVALTRAKKKLIMVGSCRTLTTVPLLKLLIEKVDEQMGIFSISKKDINKFGLKKCSQTSSLNVK